MSSPELTGLSDKGQKQNCSSADEARVYDDLDAIIPANAMPLRIIVLVVKQSHVMISAGHYLWSVIQVNLLTLHTCSHKDPFGAEQE